MGVGSSAVDMKKYVSETLLVSDIAHTDPKAWRGAFTIPISSFDINTAISNAEIRSLRKYHPGTLASLLFNAIRILDRTTALQLGLPRYIGKTDSSDSNESIDDFVGQVYLDQKEMSTEKEREALRRTKNAEALEKKLKSTAAEASKKKTDVSPTSETADTSNPSSVGAQASPYPQGVVETPREYCDFLVPERKAFQNALAYIYRIMPIVLEDDPSSIVAPNGVSENGSPYAQPDAAPYALHFLKSFFVDNKMCLGVETVNHSTQEQNNTLPKTFGGITRPLGEILVNVLVRSAFIPGFTVDLKQLVSDERAPNLPNVDGSLVWAPGVGFSTKKAAPWTNAEWAFANRKTVVDALLVTLSGSLYTPDPSRVDIFLDTITDPKRCPLASTLVCSLVNVVCSYSTFGSLPFSSHLVGQIEQFVFTAAEFVNVLLNTQKLYPSRAEAIVPNTPSNEGEHTPLSSLTAPTQAAYATIVMKQYHSAWGPLSQARNSEVLFVLKGLLHLVNNRTYSKSTRVPGTQRRLAHHDAFFLLMWKLVDRCTNFFETLTTEAEVALPFIVPLLDYAVAAKENGQLFANAQIVAFTLMRLSAARDFAILLNAPIKEHIPFAVPALTSGTYNDLLIVTLLQILGCRQQPPRKAGATSQAESNALDIRPIGAPSPLDNLAGQKSIIEKTPPLTQTSGDTKSEIAATAAAPTTVYRPTPTAIMSIHESCAIVICNISPYVTALLTTTALQLMSFFDLCIRPTWLVLHPSYPSILMFIVETFANIIQYQYRACPTLLYNLCRERAKVHKVYMEITDPLRTGNTNVQQQGESAANASPTSATMQLTLASEEVIPRAVRERIKIGTLLSAVEAAEPILVKAIAKNPSLPDPVAILSGTTLVGLLPAPHPIVVRKFAPHPSTDAWTTAVLWGFIFMYEKHVGDGHKIRLFSLQSS